MSEEYWATFSIFDHRELVYRNALALFDKVVMPVPTAPISSLKQEEIDALSADADYLQEKNAAVRAASAEIVAILDADCIPDSSWLRLFADALRAHPHSDGHSSARA